MLASELLRQGLQRQDPFLLRISLCVLASGPLSSEFLSWVDVNQFSALTFQHHLDGVFLQLCNLGLLVEAQTVLSVLEKINLQLSYKASAEVFLPSCKAVDLEAALRIAEDLVAKVNHPLSHQIIGWLLDQRSDEFV